MNKKLNYAWLLSLLMIFSITFVSCSKDDDDEVSINKDELIGTWKGDKMIEEAKGVSEETTLDETLEIREDGTYTQKDFFTENGTWKISGGKLKFFDKEGDETGDYSVTINGTKLTLYEEIDFELGTVKTTKTYNKQ